MIRKSNITRICKIILGILFVIMEFALMLYPFPNQDITIRTKFFDDTEKVHVMNAATIHELLLEKDEKGDNVFSSFLFDETDKYNIDSISQIEFVRKFKTICIAKILNNEIDGYLYQEENRVYFGTKGSELLYELSTSYLIERIIYAEWIFAIALLLLIVINAIGEKFDSTIRTNHGPIFEIQRFVREIGVYHQYITYAARADLNAEVANSYLNRLWWVLEPFLNMLVYVIVFGQVMGNSIKNYSTFVFSALLMWNYINHIINYSVKCIRNNRDIVTKIYMPKYILLLTNMVLNFIKLLFSMLVLLVMLLIFNIHVGTNILWVIPSYLLMLMLCFGVGMILMHYGVFVDDLAYAVGILITMLMFLSGVFYDVITTLSAPLNIIMLGMNPAAMVIDAMRNALLYNTITNVPLMGVWFVLAVLIMYIGLHIIYKNENGYVKVI